MTFLPEDYEAPKSNSGYMKILPGENRIRILSSPIIGWEDWKDNRPMRFKMDEKPDAPVDKSKPIRHFWAMIVWNYKEEQIQILEITQAGIRTNLEALCKDKDWGAPFTYDIKIIKTGQDQKTKYGVNPMPHKPVPQSIKDAFIARPICLEALYEGEDPFAGIGKPTKGQFDAPSTKSVESSEKVKVAPISKEQALELLEFVNSCDPDYIVKVKDGLLKMGIKDFFELPAALLEKTRKALMDNAVQFKAAKMNEELPF